MERNPWDRPNDALASPYGEDDPSLPIGQIDRRSWLRFHCSGRDGCGRGVDLGIAPGIARFGPGATIRSIARRMRCKVCGGRRILVAVVADTRSSEERRKGPHPSTLATLDQPRKAFAATGLSDPTPSSRLIWTVAGT